MDEIKTRLLEIRTRLTPALPTTGIRRSRGNVSPLNRKEIEAAQRVVQHHAVDDVQWLVDQLRAALWRLELAKEMAVSVRVYIETLETLRALDLDAERGLQKMRGHLHLMKQHLNEFVGAVRGEHDGQSTD